MYAEYKTFQNSDWQIASIKANLHQGIISVHSWCSQNNMVINSTKTKCLLPGSKQKFSTNIKLSLSLGDSPIQNGYHPEVSCLYVEYLLTWNIRVDKNVLNI